MTVQRSGAKNSAAYEVIGKTAAFQCDLFVAHRFPEFPQFSSLYFGAFNAPTFF
jgi:hypothetical protein